MTPRTASLYLVGGAVALVMLEKLTKRKDPGKATPIFVPFQGTEPAPGASAPPPSRPVLVQGDPVNLVPGKPYRVTIITHRAANIASISQVIGEAQNRGFSNVSASKSKPAGWPGAVNGDYYVSGLYTGAPKNQPRTEGNIFGSVDVAEVWMG